MRLSSFSVVNYRSITNARKIQTNNMTVLVGKNNEGKSNILRALTLAMDIMKMYSSDPRSLRLSANYLKNRTRYVWERDYPLSLQERNPNGFSSIELDFELNTGDISAIRGLTGIRLSGHIPVRVSINHSSVKIDIPKRGTPAFSNVENKLKIIEYVCSKIDFNFIPAVRTEHDALRVVELLIEKQLLTLELNPEYIEATHTMERLQQDVLNGISAQLVGPLQEFLPSVRDVQIHLQKDQRRSSLRHSANVIIDDGTPTPLQQKGDGIKSLTALAMLNIPTSRDRVSVIAIEEPESHLHPESARQLYETINALSVNHQVVLTTHSPLFVNRSNLKENIIVDSGKATPVKKIKDIRDVLGTKVSDNLINAEHVLVVEGEDDKIALEKLLPQMSESIKKAIQNGTLIIDDMSGTGNLPYKLSFYRNLQCKYHVLLDNDDAGRRAGQDAETQGLLNTRNTTYTMCNGSPNAEFEDCLEKATYVEAVLSEFGVDLNVAEFRGNKKWSDRVAECFKSQGKQWNDTMEKRVKFCVAEALPSDPAVALNQHKRSSIDALVIALNSLIA
ncbi:MAG: AAA family ATPase [Oscillibacter sp.]|nr:AAA family ATPase [Oscillibacter sp.]